MYIYIYIYQSVSNITIIIVISSQITVNNNKSSSTGLVIGLYGGKDIKISNASTIVVKVEPTNVQSKQVKGIYSLEGNVIVTGASMIDMHITGIDVDGIHANQNVEYVIELTPDDIKAIKNNTELYNYSVTGNDAYLDYIYQDNTDVNGKYYSKFINDEFRKNFTVISGEVVR